MSEKERKIIKLRLIKALDIMDTKGRYDEGCMNKMLWAEQWGELRTNINSALVRLESIKHER